MTATASSRRTATVHLHTKLHVGPIDQRIFGGFLEHMGRSIYEGIYDPASPHADERGVRTDVLAALRELAFTVMRYPGGNFVSNYHWQDGVGPTNGRPTVRESAWGTIEPNTFGTDEFLAVAVEMDWMPMFAANLGTGTPEEAADWVEYCNADTPTRFADLRRAHGRDEPWNVPIWCLGNEVDGPWQIGHSPVHEYGVKAQQAAHQMKLVDPSIEVVVSGTSIPANSSWMTWDREALEAVGGLADHLSTHRYVDNDDGDTAAFLTTGALIDEQIEAMDAVCRYVAAKRRSRRRPTIAFDEWNVWYRTRNSEGMQRGGAFPMPLIEEVYDVQDALVVMSFLNSFIRHADVVKVANLAQVVNVIAPILTRTDDVLRQTIFHTLAMFRERRAGTSLRVGYEGPTVPGPRSAVAGVDVAAIHDDNRLHLHLVNRVTDGPVELTVDVPDRPIDGLASGERVHDDDPTTANSWEQPDRITRQPFDEVAIRDGVARLTLPPFSATSVTLDLAG